MITVTVRTFARYRELLGFEQRDYDLSEPASLAELLAQPQLAKLPAEALLAVNQAFAEPDALLVRGNRVALDPPGSGRRGEPLCPECRTAWRWGRHRPWRL